MRPLSSLSKVSPIIVLDASTAINLNASGCAADVLACFRGRVFVPDIVLGELEDGIAKGRRDAEMTKHLVKAGLLRLVSLGDQGLRCFEQLVIGDAATTLDDGEAATIAYAVETGGAAVIDERKATRLCAERFPGLHLAATLDLFTHDDVHTALGRAALSNAVFSALTGARMRVPAHHVTWVGDLIGSERARQCSSLPRSARVLQDTAMD